MRKKATIDCENCGFVGIVTYPADLFDRRDIAYCPVCGSDVSEGNEEEELE
jgi:predicted RNA-binding Zn-ribbon protein involved in translation (DUF1610 family)